VHPVTCVSIDAGSDSGYGFSECPVFASTINSRPVDDAITVSRPCFDGSMSASVGDDNRYARRSNVFCYIVHTQLQ